LREIFDCVHAPSSPMDKITEFSFSTYAKRRMRARKLSPGAIKIKYEKKRIHQRHGPNGGVVYRFEKTLPKYQLMTVAEVRKTKAWVATACRLKEATPRKMRGKEQVMEVEPSVHAAYLWLKLGAKVAWTYVVAERPKIICTADLDARGNVVGLELIGVDPFNTRKVMALLPEFLKLDKLRFITAEAAELLNYGTRNG
jgi:hypothetical protein